MGVGPFGLGYRLNKSACSGVALIVKLKSGEADLDFTTIDPRYAPQITGLHADGEGSILFVRVGGNYTSTRGDFKRRGKQWTWQK